MPKFKTNLKKIDFEEGKLVRTDIDDKSMVGEGNYTASTSTGSLNANTTFSISQ